MSVATTSAGAIVRAPLFYAAFVGALTLVLFGHTWLQLIDLWNSDPNYSHGYAIPILAAFPAWSYLKRVGIPSSGEPVLGAMYLLSGGFLHLTAQVIVLPPVDFVALAFVLRGLAVTAGGREWARGFTFPILFLFFMFPLPVTWTGYVALWLQDAVTRVSAVVLEPFVACYRRGNTLSLAGVSQPLVVAEECSGLRQLVAFFAAGAYYAYLSRRAVTFRIVVVLAAIPVAILANVLRVTLMAVGALHFGTDWLGGRLHYAPAVFSIPAGIGLYALLGWALAKLWAPRDAGGEP
jgi:exosortase